MRRKATGVRLGRVLSVGMMAGILVLATAPPASALPSESPDNIDSTNGFVYAIAQVGATIYIGGEFSVAGGQSRSNLAAIDAVTGRVTDWNPGADRRVYALEPGLDGTLYVGGDFTRVGGQNRRKVAQVRADGTVTAWRATMQGRVAAIAMSATGDRVYLGGLFTAVNGVARNYAAALATSDATLLGWDPRPDAKVWDLDISPSGTVFVGGFFSTISGVSRRGVAELDPVTATATSFRATVLVPVYDVALWAGRIYLAAGGSGGRIVAYALSTSTGALLWAKQTNGDMQAVAASSSAVYIGGHQSVLDGRASEKIGALHPDTGALLDWRPGASGGKGPYALVVTDSALLVGGEFTRIGGESRGGFARFSGTP